MQEQITKRLNELKSEYEAGQKILTELEVKQAGLRETLLRISGAIQVLEELAASAPATVSAPPLAETPGG